MCIHLESSHWIVPLGEQPLGISPQELPTEVRFTPLPAAILWSYKVHCYCPQPHFNYGNAGNQPRCPSSTRLTKPPARIAATDLLMSGPRTATATLLHPLCEVRVSQEPRRVCVWEPAGPVVANVRPLRAVVSQRCRVYTMPGCA